MSKRFFAVIVFVCCVLFAPPSEAVLVELSEEDVKDAVQYGKDNKNAGYLEFFKDWRADLGYGAGSARVITPFSKIAFEAKHAEDEGVDREVIEEILKESKGRLAFGVSVYGEARDFAQNASAVLIQGKKTVKPVESRPVMKAEVTDSWPNPPAYRAICYFYFSTKGIDLEGTVALVVSVADQKDVRFNFDLSGIR